MLLEEQRCIDLFGKQISDYIIAHESVNCWHSLYVHIVPKELTGIRDKYYIGITEHLPKKRWGSNGNKYKNHPFYNAILQYGWDNMEHIIVSCSLSKSDAECVESMCIEYTHSYDDRYGYNAQLRNGVNTTQMKPVHKFDLSGNYIETFRSLSDASKCLQVPKDRISAAAKNGWRAGGFRWSYNTEYCFDYSKSIHNQPVYQFTLGGQFVKKYDDIRSAFEENKYEKIEPLFACAGGASTQAYNYVWVYERDVETFEFPTRFFGGRTPIVRFTKDGEYVDEFACKADAKRKTGCSLWKINKCLEDPNYDWNGYIWKLKNNEVA